MDRNYQLAEIIDIENVDIRTKDEGLQSLYEYYLKNNLILPKDYIIPKQYLK